MSRLRILLDNGHGQETPGKRSPVWADGSQLFEYEFNRDIVRRIARMLAHKSITFDIIVHENTDIPLYVRANRVNHICSVNGAKNCLLLSIHANAAGGTGWEVWTSIGQTMADDYAEIIYKRAKIAFPEWEMRYDMTDGDHDKEDDFTILKKTQCPAVLTENFFMDTERDCRFIMSEAGRNRIARMHFDAILDCIAWYEKQSR